MAKEFLGSASDTGSVALRLQAANVRMLIDAAAAADEGVSCQR